MIQTHEQVGITNEPENDNQGSETISETERQYFEQGDSNIEQQEQDRQGTEVHARTLDIETIEDDDDGINTEPFFPDENTKYEVHVETGEPNEQQTESMPNSNMPNTESSNLEESQKNDGDFATEQFNDNENIDLHDLEKSEQQGSSSDSHDNSGKNEEFYDVHIQQERSDTHHEVVMESHEDNKVEESEQSETRHKVVMESHEDNKVGESEGQMHEEKESRISDHDAKQTGQHIEDVNIRIDETSQGIDQSIESKEIDPSIERIESQSETSDNAGIPELDEGHMHSSKDIEAETNLEKLDSYIQDTLSEVIKELDDSEIIREIPREEHLGREQIVADIDRGDAHLEKRGDTNLEFEPEEPVKDVEQEENLEEEETIADREGGNVNVEKQDDTSSVFEPDVPGENVAQEEQFEEEETIGDTEEGSENLEIQEDSESEEAVDDSPEPQKSNRLADIDVVFLSEDKDEPESSNTPGTRFSEEEKSGQDESVLKEGDDSPSQEQSSSTEEQRTSTEEPRTSNEEESTSNEEQRTSSEEQHTSNEEQRTSTEEQHTSNEEERTSTEEQHTSNEEQRTSTEEQHTSNEEQRTSIEEETTSNEEESSFTGTASESSTENSASSADGNGMSSSQDEEGKKGKNFLFID